jgi:hypothetical protein
VNIEEIDTTTKRSDEEVKAAPTERLRQVEAVVVELLLHRSITTITSVGSSGNDELDSTEWGQQ